MSILIEVYLFQFLVVVVASSFANIGSSKLLAGQTASQSHIRGEKEAEKKLEKEETFSEIQSWFAAFTFLKRERLDARVKVLKKEKTKP